MAIKRAKASSSARILPPKIDGLLKASFTASVLQKKYEEEGKGYREEVKLYFENNSDGFEVTLSESFKTEYGSVNMKARSNYKYDTDKIIELVRSGKLSLETLVNVVSFDAKELKTAIGEREFESCATLSTTEYLELRPSKEFKEEVDKIFASRDANLDSLRPEEPKVVAPKVEAPKLVVAVAEPVAAAPQAEAEAEEDAAASIERLRLAKASVKNRTRERLTSPDDDLDAILAAGGDK